MTPTATTTAPRIAWRFAPYAVLSAVHVTILAVGDSPLETPTKLLLMPVLAITVLWTAQGVRRTAPLALLLSAIGFSWIGDGAAVFLPFAPEIPTMLVSFAIAHLAYIVLFWRHLAARRMPWWALVYAVWWIAMLAVLLPRLGALTVGVALYGIVLGGTAVLATRCHPLIVSGAVFFLASDTLLAFRLFTPELMPAWTSPLVMVTYTLGQGLIAAGAITTLRRRP